MITLSQPTQLAVNILQEKGQKNKNAQVKYKGILVSDCTFTNLMNHKHLNKYIAWEQ